MKNGYKKKMEINRWLLKKNVSGEKKKSLQNTLILTKNKSLKCLNNHINY